MLQSLIIYLVKVIAISGLFLLYYSVALRNKRFHCYNRFYLLLTLVLSLCLPLMHMEWFTFSSNSSKAIHLLNIINANGEDDVIVKASNSLDWQQLILLISIFISTVFLGVAFNSIIKIFRLKKHYAVTKTNEFDFINTDLQSAPFSFLKNIFWRNDLNVDDAINRQILQHEITHVQQKHSWDKLFVQFVLCFYWMNPFFWWLQKELNLIHEFIADEKAVSNNDAESFAKMLLTSQFGSFQFYPAQSIFYSPIKRRLIMLTTSKKPQLSYLRRIMVLPLLVCSICLFAFKLNEQSASTRNNIAVTKATSNFKLVVDAGHGGKDYGAANDDIYEKDIVLKIAKEIKSLSSQYGIDVVLTRDDDVFQNPKEKSDFANNQNANALISIHVNNIPQNSPQINTSKTSGFEVVIAGKNPVTLNGSTILGSAIIQNLQKDFTVAPALMQPTTGVWVLKNSTIPAVLIECGYITNNNDVKLLQQDDKIEMIAKNILQGVAMYANNKVDTSNLFQIKNSDANIRLQKEEQHVEDTTIPSLEKALYIVNEKELPKKEFKKIRGENVAEINVLKGEYAINKYGDKGKNGVIEVTLKPASANDTIPNQQKSSNYDKEFTQTEHEPKFPGGNEAWKKYLENNLKASTPADKGAPPGTYTVTVSFLVDDNGKVSEAKAIKDPGFGTAVEAVRIIANGPNWIPAMQNGHKVVYRQKQNITFQITEQDAKKS